MATDILISVMGTANPGEQIIMVYMKLIINTNQEARYYINGFLLPLLG